MGNTRQNAKSKTNTVGKQRALINPFHSNIQDYTGCEVRMKFKFIKNIHCWALCFDGTEKYKFTFTSSLQILNWTAARNKLKLYTLTDHGTATVHNPKILLPSKLYHIMLRIRRVCLFFNHTFHLNCIRFSYYRLAGYISTTHIDYLYLQLICFITNAQNAVVSTNVIFMFGT